MNTSPANDTPATEPTGFFGPDFRAYASFWRRLLGMLSLYAAVSAPLLLGYSWLLHEAGESFSPHELARLSREGPLLWHSEYYHAGILRPAIAAELKPRVAVIGSSRVMQFRDRMFARVKPEEFYVAGTSGNYSLPCLTTLQRLIRTGHPPELVVLGLDFWWFQAAVPAEAQSKTRLCRLLGYDLYRRGRTAREALAEWSGLVLDQVQLYQHAWRDPRFYSALMAPHVEPDSGRCLYSVQSRLGGDGYRNDGSYRYTVLLRKFANAGVRDGGNDVDWSKTWSGTFSGNFVSEAALDDLREFIAECQRVGTKLVVFLPPIASGPLAYVRQHPEAAGFWKVFPEPVRRICEANRIPYHDFTNADHLLAEDGNFFDWYHGSEKLYGRLILEMLKDSPTAEALCRYIDTAELRRTVEAAGDRFLLYGD